MDHQGHKEDTKNTKLKKVIDQRSSIIVLLDTKDTKKTQRTQSLRKPSTNDHRSSFYWTTKDHKEDTKNTKLKKAIAQRPSIIVLLDHQGHKEDTKNTELKKANDHRSSICVKPFDKNKKGQSFIAGLEHGLTIHYRHPLQNIA